MKPLLKTRLTSANPTVIPIRPPLDSKIDVSFLSLVFQLDEFVLDTLRSWSIPVLRLALGFVFLWFGALKILGSSPVAALIQETYTFLPISTFVFLLGVWEMLVGIGMILKRALRCVLLLLGVHLVGTFTAIWLNPHVFFVQGLPFRLTVDGEFVIKNVVLISAALVIAGYEVKPLRRP
jgi:putative oxidoreductase